MSNLFINLLFLTSFEQIKTAAYAIMLVLTACGCFVIGINLMSKGFVHASSSSKSFFARKFTSPRRLTNVNAGIIHSGLTQSSDSTSIFVIQMCDLGLISLHQACAAIIGANIGTCITSFIVALSSFNFSPYFSALGFVGSLLLLTNKGKAKITGEILSGFGLLFIGIELLDSYVKDPAFAEVLQYLFNISDNAYMLVFMGFILTAIVQSSSVSTIIAIFLCGSNLLSFRSALLIVTGANIGTCVTGIIAASKSSVNARRAAAFHMLFNIIGVAILFVVFAFKETEFLNLLTSLNIGVEFEIAIFHIAFNIVSAIFMFPFFRLSVWFVKKVVRY